MRKVSVTVPSSGKAFKFIGDNDDGAVWTDEGAVWTALCEGIKGILRKYLSLKEQTRIYVDVGGEIRRRMHPLARMTCGQISDHFRRE